MKVALNTITSLRSILTDENVRLLWPWSYGSWIYNYLWNQCLSPLMLWIRISTRTKCTTLCDKVCQWLAAGQWFSPGPPVSSTNKTDCHDITEILLKVVLNTIKQSNKQWKRCYKILQAGSLTGSKEKERENQKLW